MWFVCLFKRHQWRTWFDKKMRLNRTTCDRRGAEKMKLIDTDVNPSYWL